MHLWNCSKLYLGGLISKKLGDLGDLTAPSPPELGGWRKLPPRWLSSWWGIRFGVPIGGLLFLRDSSVRDRLAKAFTSSSDSWDNFRWISSLLPAKTTSLYLLTTYLPTWILGKLRTSGTKIKRRIPLEKLLYQQATDICLKLATEIIVFVQREREKPRNCLTNVVQPREVQVMSFCITDDSWIR